MYKRQIDKSIIDDNKNQLPQKFKAYFLFFKASLIGHCKFKRKKKKLLDVFVLGNLQHANIVNIQTNSLISTNIEVLTSKYKGILNLSRYICFLCIAVDLMLCFYLMFGKLPF